MKITSTNPSILSAVDSGGADGARAPPEFGDSEKGQSLISAYQSLAITMNTPGSKKLSKGTDTNLGPPVLGTLVGRIDNSVHLFFFKIFFSFYCLLGTTV